MRPLHPRVLMTVLVAVSLVCPFGPRPVCAPSWAAEKDASTIEDGVLDKISLKVAALPKDVGLIVRRFPADKADAGTAAKGDNQKRLDAVKMLQAEGPRMLAEAIVSELGAGGGFAFVRESDEAPPENALVVEGRFTQIDPGSRAKRYWAGFGAGKSGVAVEGVVRSADGQVLAEFSHRRHSGIGIGGGEYVKFLSDDTRDVGHDIGVFLKRWASGGNLRKDAD